MCLCVHVDVDVHACVPFCSKAVNREYEEFVLTVGDFDERVFLGTDADEEIGTPRKTVPGALGGPGSAQKQLQQHIEKVHTHTHYNIRKSQLF